MRHDSGTIVKQLVELYILKTEYGTWLRIVIASTFRCVAACSQQATWEQEHPTLFAAPVLTRLLL